MSETINKLDLKSMNISEDKKNKLKELFPEVFSEDKIDFEKLKLTLGEDISDSEERFGLQWPGKKDCFKVIQEPSIGTLKPCKEESVNWDSTENIFIEGDNLEVLKLLQKSYYSKIKMIYIDPPYNTGGEFIYPDRFQENLDTYLAYTGQVNDEGKKFSTNTETSGRFHSNWLNMMYPRLFLARNLLKNDGVLIIHIDENEVCNLEQLCKEIFGEENFIGNIIWNKLNPKGDSKGVSYQHENILIFAKNKEYLFSKSEFKRPKKNAEKILEKAKSLYEKLPLDEANKEFSSWIRKQNFSGGEKAYSKIDLKGNVYRGVSMAWPNKKKAPDDYFVPLIHPITNKPCPFPDRGWRNPSSTMKKLLEDDLILFGDDETKQPERKYFLKENMEENIPSILEYGGSDDELFKRIKLSFDNPKPYLFVSDIINPLVENGDIVLDFFAGSSTTAHAVIELNNKYSKNIKFIMIQLPEPISNTGETSKINSISNLSVERIKRITDNYKESSSSDLGLKIYKLDRSNFKTWEGNTENETLQNQLEKALFHIDINSSKEDILTEIFLKSGFELTVKIDSKVLANKEVFSIENDSLIICLDDNLNDEVIKEIAVLEPARVVFLDSGFYQKDELKANAAQILKSFGVEDFKTI
ncbi:site-specific DNA-methyltransferase [Flavobacterium celericrescens]|uniref:site-specific DNA-methyltransferase (adenine-specific) n=1 Tax=Flavobacterium celericrescens TaxID=2709780 RepID=A0ABX0I8V7_9FLAO|nr:site-specific DNA-methyltransferase [Flavobacterium celericrescens]NHM03608.1 site-specific DNA-methyltransferase [Flavobacterium celericrescens]